MDSGDGWEGTWGLEVFSITFLEVMFTFLWFLFHRRSFGSKTPTGHLSAFSESRFSHLHP